MLKYEFSIIVIDLLSIDSMEYRLIKVVNYCIKGVYI